MYESHFRLREKPFSIIPDPSFIYWSKVHSRAFAMLEYSILNHAGFTVITGEIGCGKTTLIRHLLNQINDRIVVGILPDTQIETRDLVKWALLAFEQSIEQTSEVAAFRDFRDFVYAQGRKGKRTVLIVDEAQNLSVSGLEKLRMLSNINTENHTYLQIILAGQPQLRELLQRPELTQFMQRVTSEFNIDPLPPQEVKNYILHRLLQVESHTALFSDKAIHRIAEESRGIPRLINILCDTALVYAYARGARYVDSRIVKSLIADRNTQGISGPHDQSHEVTHT
jgi:general secretion pathway protein A